MEEAETSPDLQLTLAQLLGAFWTEGAGNKEKYINMIMTNEGVIRSAK